MKYLLIAVGVTLATIFSCESQRETNALVRPIVLAIDSTPSKCPTSDRVLALNKEVDSLRMELLLSKFRLNRVAYYLKIVKKNPKNTKYLTSWLTRTLN